MSRNKDLSARIRSINASITTIGRLYGKDSSIYRRFTSTIQKAGGKTRFSKKMFDGDMRQLAKAYNALETLENSQYTTKEGRKQIWKKGRDTFAMNHSDYDESTIVKMFDVFKNSSFSRFDQIYKHSSELFVDAIMNAFEEDNISKKKMTEKVDYFLTHLEEFNDGKTSNDLSTALERFTQWIST